MGLEFIYQNAEWMPSSTLCVRYGHFCLDYYGILSILLSAQVISSGTANTFQSYLISSGLLQKYKALDLTELQYLAIVVDSEEAHNTSKIVELLHWLSIVGVKNICLYDMDGVLKDSKEIILEELADRSYEKGTFSDQKQMTFEFSSFSDGKEGAAKAANFLCSKLWRTRTHLLLVYGLARCHLGFPAWKLRYTEIVHMGPLKAMKYGAIVKAIYKFATVRQNYGS
ncbi:hypothetical protein GIB67_028662 [Kingdonia uniflora]|uniref:ditrans,polycis-polyprenyl diphosphate synthase [(2E,6E)-farnesyldiphosphate specific] n=1 Tax=Kingdonia uniflora TaxID=39325 RepID=A0A7J7L1F4_9MAGN|nr:hypothetical protein GIB67_028662 [Kingdonia uniflora]